MDKAPFNLQPSPRLTSWRRFKDAFARHGIALGGVSVIAAVLLIFFYLAWEVFPLFLSADAEEREIPLAVEQGDLIHLEVDEQEEVAFTLDRQGRAHFHRLSDGELLLERQLPLNDAAISAMARSGPSSGELALAFGAGQVLIVKVNYKTTFPDGERVIVPELDYPYGTEPLTLESRGMRLTALSYREDDNRMSIAMLREDGSVGLTRYAKAASFLTGEVTLTPTRGELELSGASPLSLAMSANQRWLYVSLEGGSVAFVDIRDPARPALVSQQQVTSSQITAMNMLLGGISLLVGDDRGRIVQYFPVRDAGGRHSLEAIRAFTPMAEAVVRLVPEPRRKGFVAIDQAGNAGVYHSTAQRRVVSGHFVDGEPQAVAMSPRSTALVLIDGLGESQFWSLHNEHPEVSWGALWGKVWYENYDEPAFIWQSSAATNDFEPKFSLTPLAFGTLKAALYAMLFAVPLSIAAAVYTAYFMAPRMRRLVKPTIEIMAALPTVILGFLAGLWFAPFLEENLTGVFLVIFALPIGMLAFAWAWSRLPKGLRYRIPEGWQGALLIPVVLAIGWLGLLLGQPVENVLVGGDMRQWLSADLGWTYDQRNAMVVGVAMGFAVIPTIFSIAEDAVFSVPNSLTQGSLALGATPWQTMVRVVIPTASPGIFSALMIGFGRAVGETMIVLMATGNTPIMDMNIFEGMRTLSANIAVEMPESEVGSTHFRVLFLAALVLFIFTFFFNTGAEIIRQRLREKYSSL